jgi:hypothetical protein
MESLPLAIARCKGARGPQRPSGQSVPHIALILQGTLPPRMALL